MSNPQVAKPMQSVMSVEKRVTTVVGRLAAVVVFFLMLSAGSPSHADGVWQGTWSTTYGQVNLRQDGRRVWGDYVAQAGVIEARTSDDGRMLRGTYLRSDQSWGWFSFSLSANGTSWRGSWRASDLPRPNDTAWNASARTSSSAPVLRNAVGLGPFWPPTYAGPPFGNHARFVFGPTERDPYDPSQSGPALHKQLGGWHGEYSVDLPPYGYGLSVNVDDTPTIPTSAVRSPLVDLAAFAPDGSARDGAPLCPAAMHPAFCEDLHVRFGPDVSTRTSMQITQLGSLANDAQVLVAFLLSGDAAPRLLSLTQAGTGTRLQIWHPNRGVDLDTIVQKQPRICEGGMSCDRSRVGLMDRQPGPLSSTSFVNAYMQLPDARTAAHAARATAAPPQRQNRFAEGLYELLDQNDGQIGMLDLLMTADGAVYGTGDIYPTSALAGQSMIPVIVATEHDGRDGFQLALTPTDGPARQTMRLLITERDDGTWHGTLIRGDDWHLVSLSDGAGMFDMPGIGVYGPSYSLRNTDGQAALLRTAPRSDAAQTGMVAANVRNLLVLQCTPEIESLTWEQSTDTTRRAMLDRVWCEVRHDRQLPGWIPGYFLDPNAQ